MKPIRFSKYVEDYAKKRGFTVAEVKTLFAQVPGAQPSSADWIVEKILHMEMNGMAEVYETKQVRPVFVEETGEIVVITVYTYYF